MMTGRPRLFPAGLYATLLVALSCLVAPPVPRRVQAWLQAVQCWPVHVVADLVGGRPQSVPSPGAAVLAERLRQRQEEAALAGARGWLPEGLEPVLCRVVARTGRGGAGLPARLVLDRPAASVRDCLPFVTHGDVLLGFLHAESPPRRAAVALLHDADAAGDLPRRVAAGIELGDEALRFVVEPAPRVERFPLRCRMLDDPYAASRLEHSGHDVRTVPLRGDPLGSVPSGLRLGRLQVWGYRGSVGTPIELFVMPALAPESISVVVLWRPRRQGGARLPPALRDVVQREVRVVRLPAPPPAEERWLLRSTASARLVPGGAVLHDGWVVGSVRQSGGSHGLAAPFGRTAQVWSAVLLPRDSGAPPIGVMVRAAGERRRGDERELELAVEGAARPLRHGMLFTGANGAAFPAGLPVGEAIPVAGGTRLRLTLPLARTEVLAAVIPAEER